MSEQHDKLLSGRVRERFNAQARQRAYMALAAAKQAAFDAVEGVEDEQLEDALNAYRLIRALQKELGDLAQI